MKQYIVGKLVNGEKFEKKIDSNLRWFFLWDNQLQTVDLTPLEKCPKLRWLYLSNNQLQTVDLTPLKEFMEKGQLDVEIDSHVKKLNLEPETEIEQEQKIGDADSQVKKAFREQEQVTEQKKYKN